MTDPRQTPMSPAMRSFAAEARAGSHPRVTIGISFYNAEATLADALRSVFAQSFTEWELLLIDDGSTDRSLSLARAIHDPRVFVLSDGLNLGLPGRLNQIAQLAKGEYYARFDADDLMHSARLARQIEYLDAHPEYSLVDTGMYALDMANAIHGKRDCLPRVIEPAAWVEQGVPNHSSVLGRTTWFQRNPYDACYSRAEDHELWCRTFHEGRFAHIPEPLLFYREFGVPTLQKYLETWKTDRQIIRRYGEGIVGRRTSARLYWKAWAKSCLWRIIVLCHQEHRIIDRRSVPVPTEEMAAAMEELTRVLRTPLPGGEHSTAE